MSGPLLRRALGRWSVIRGRRRGLSERDSLLIYRNGVVLADLEGYGLFDPLYYRSKYPDLDIEKDELLMHYLTVGWREGRNPSPAFDTVFYLESNADVLTTGVSPLLHYFCYGTSEGRSPHPVLGVKRDLRRPSLQEIYSGSVAFSVHLEPAPDWAAPDISELIAYLETVAGATGGGHVHNR